jgi:structural maintenance of chromosome 1
MYAPNFLVLQYLYYCFQAEKQLELQLFKLFHNEAEIDELADELQKKTAQSERENRKRERIEDEIKEKKKEQGKAARELTKVEQSIKESVG